MAQSGKNYVEDIPGNGFNVQKGVKVDTGPPGLFSRGGDRFEPGSKGDPGKDQQNQQKHPIEYRIDAAKNSPDIGSSTYKARTINIDVHIQPRHSFDSGKDGYVFTNGDDLYTYVSYRDISDQDNIIFNFVDEDGSKEPVTDYELVVKCQSVNALIFYIPDMFIESAEEGPTIVGIEKGELYRPRAGVVKKYSETQNVLQVISSFVDLYGDNIRIISLDGLESNICSGKRCPEPVYDREVVEIQAENFITPIPICEWIEKIDRSTNLSLINKRPTNQNSGRKVKSAKLDLSASNVI